MATLRIKFLATSIGMQMHFAVFLPESIARSTAAVPGERLQVLWLLHGESGDCSDWLRLSMVEHHAQEANIALVMPNVDNSMYMDMAHGGYPYFTYLTEDLPRHVRHLLPVLSDRREDNFVAGVSTGGYGAVKWMLRMPEMFSGCICLSGELDMVSALQRREAQNTLSDDWIAAFGAASQLAGTPDDIRHLVSPGVAPPVLRSSIHLASGGQDPGLESNRQVAARLRELGADVDIRESPHERGWPFWDAALREFIVKEVASRGRMNGS